MKIERIELYSLSLPFIRPFRTSSATNLDHPFILVAVMSEGLIGWGECPAPRTPYYTYETLDTAWYLLTDFLIPAVLGKNLDTPESVTTCFRGVRGHPMAKSALESAVWDLFAKAKAIPLSKLLGGERKRVSVGISLGIPPTLDDLLTRVAQAVEQGYRRVKIKIEPGWEVVPLKTLRERYPDLAIMADANAAFSLKDITLFQEIDKLNLLMIEQPLDHQDLLAHAQLQAQLRTPICLDESIDSPPVAQLAIALQACRILNLKVSRVGGMTHLLAIHRLCQVAQIPLWCGGMTEAGVGRATNLHIASLANFALPGDISATERYFSRDIAFPTFKLNPEDSTINVPRGVGIGVEVDLPYVQQLSQAHRVFQP